jgi:predicted regulator of Ras-like GTPase activity (Roadblock/LC7/MglB family)
MKTLQTIVQETAQENGFTSLVLTDASGFPLASSSSRAEAETPAAVAALIQRVAERSRSHLGLEAMHEMTLYDAAGQLLVCRPFVSGEHTLLVAAMIPPHKTYRRAMNRAIRLLQQAWSARHGARQ